VPDILDIPKACQGLWRSIGYNRILDIKASAYAIYTVTAGHASVVEQGSPLQFRQAFDRIEATERGALALYHAHDLTRYQFERREAFEPVQRIHTVPSEDPVANFDAFREVFEENYAFFKLRGVDWSALCQAARARVCTTTTSDALLDTFEVMIAPLADMHVYVTSPERRVRSAASPRGPFQALKATFDLPMPVLSQRASVDRISARLRETLLKDFSATLGNFRQAGNDIVAWGTLGQGVGYLSLLRMFGFAASEAARGANDLPRRLWESGPFMGADMSSLEDILDAALSDLSQQNTLIVDVRLNGGGFDRAGLLLCERLTDVPRTAFVKKATCALGFTPPQSVMIRPSRRTRFTKPVILLISPLSVSAGEVCALAMSSLPSVTIMGENTQGILSDNLYHRLPCGWEVSLSNEVYETTRGCCYESVGVPPVESLAPLTSENFLADLRTGLMSAVKRAAGT
jgi:carboxyl-terminal processing protease